MKDNLKPKIGQQILSEVIYLWPLDIVLDTVQQDFPLLQTLIADILENFSE
jgi:hypothetical protein